MQNSVFPQPRLPSFGGTYCVAVLGVLMVGALAPAGDQVRDEEAVSICLSRVRDFHGGAGPWAVSGYRIGERALKELDSPRYSISLLVTHHAPAQVQYSCIADGVQAATGASVGKMNLRTEIAALADLCTIVEDCRSGRKLKFTLRPEFQRSVLNLPKDQLEEVGKRVARLPDDEVFQVQELHP